MSVTKWSGVSVSVQSALATAVAITGISKASPGVVSHSGTNPTDGDWVLLQVEGMNQVRERVFRVANAASGTFELEGEDTTDYDTFTSGTFAVVTFGTSLSTIASVSPSGGEANFLDTTTIHDTVQKQIPGFRSPISYSMESHWEPGNAGLVALRDADNNGEQLAVLFGFPNGAKSAFYGYSSAPIFPAGTEIVTTPLSISASNLPTSYAT